MPSDDVLWAAIVLTGFWAVLSYFILSWSRSIRNQLREMAQRTQRMDTLWSGARTDVGALVREVSDKLGNAELEWMVALVQKAPPIRAVKKVVVRRG